MIARFLAWERWVSAPMLPPRLFKIPTCVAASVTAFLMSGAPSSAVFLASQYFQFGLGFSPLGTGPGLLMVAGMLLQAAVFGWFAFVSSAGVAFAQLALPLSSPGSASRWRCRPPRLPS